MKTKYKINLTSEQARSLLSNYPINTGSTSFFSLAFPETFQEVGINQRPQSRFTLLGLTISEDPDRANERVFGISYTDHDDDDQHDSEDHFLFSKNELILTKLIGKRLEKYNKKYKNTHHGDKSYLINTDK